LAAAGITRDRVINRTVDSFTEWVSTPKAERLSLVTW